MENTKIAVVSSQCPAQLFLSTLRELSVLAARRSSSQSSSSSSSRSSLSLSQKNKDAAAAPCVADLKTFVRQALTGPRFVGDGALGNPEDATSQNAFLKESVRSTAASIRGGGALRITLGGQVLSDEVPLADFVSAALRVSSEDAATEPVRFYFDVLPSPSDKSSSSPSDSWSSSKTASPYQHHHHHPGHQYGAHNPMSMYHGHQYYPGYPPFGLDTRIHQQHHHFQMPGVVAARTSPSSAPLPAAGNANQLPAHPQQHHPFLPHHAQHHHPAPAANGMHPGVPHVPPPGMLPAVGPAAGFPLMPPGMAPFAAAPYPHAQLYPQGLMFVPAANAPPPGMFPPVPGDAQEGPLVQQFVENADVAVPEPEVPQQQQEDPHQEENEQQRRHRRVVARIRVHWLDGLLMIRLMFFCVVFSRGQPWTSWRALTLILFSICFYLYKTRILLWLVYVLAPQFVMRRLAPTGRRRRRRGNRGGNANANAGAAGGEDGLRRRPNAAAAADGDGAVDGDDQQPPAVQPRAHIVEERTGLLVNIEKFVLGILVSLVPAIQVRRYQGPPEDGHAPAEQLDDAAREQLQNDERMARELQARLQDDHEEDDVGLGALAVVRDGEGDEDDGEDEDDDEEHQQPPPVQQPIAAVG